jgi:hypothetical protein
MKLLLLSIVLGVCAMAAACGGGEDNGSDPDRRALMDVAAFIRNEPQVNQFEPEGVVLNTGKRDCVIPVKPEARSVIEGTCDWRAEVADDGGWVVFVTETWDCEDYNAIEGTGNFCTAETGTHTWTYRVTPEGEVRLFNEQGDPPPEGLGEGDTIPATPTIAPTP